MRSRRDPPGYPEPSAEETLPWPSPMTCHVETLLCLKIVKTFMQKGVSTGVPFEDIPFNPCVYVNSPQSGKPPNGLGHVEGQAAWTRRCCGSSAASALSTAVSRSLQARNVFDPSRSARIPSRTRHER